MIKLTGERVNKLNTRLNVSKPLQNVNFGATDIQRNILPVHDNYGRYLAFRGHIDSLKPVENIEIKEPVSLKLSKLREEMKKENIDVWLERYTDKYLNEYVDKRESQGIYISDFTGSTGEVLITPDKAHLLVDGRYHEQADKQVDHKCYTVEKLNSAEDWDDRMKLLLAKMSKDKPITVGYDPNKFSLELLEELKDFFAQINAKITFKPIKENLVDKIRGAVTPKEPMLLREIPKSLVGESSEEKLSKLRTTLKASKIDGMVITDLVDISYLTNLRGKDIDYNSTFKARCFVSQDKAFVFCDPRKVSDEIKEHLKNTIEFKPEEDMYKTIREVTNSTNDKFVIGYSDSSTTEAVYSELKAINNNKIQLKSMSDKPVEEMRSIKNEVEMETIKDGLRRADLAVADTIEWINQQIIDGKKITEKDLENKMFEMHTKHGADGLSFETIPGSGPNSSIVHYGLGDITDPNHVYKTISMGELVLLDTGGYYKGGYATDLTRTFLAGSDIAAKMLEEKNIEDLNKKREVYTTVLKGAIRGLYAELPPHSNGNYLDDIVRTPIKETGQNYDHSTGHGIGIVVHEDPPSVGGMSELKEGEVFSIEPGIYIPDWGGVRFENIVTVVEHPNRIKAKKGWHIIKPLTYAPIDMNLVDKSMLSPKELEYVEDYNQKSEELLSTKIT